MLSAQNANLELGAAPEPVNFRANRSEFERIEYLCPILLGAVHAIVDASTVSSVMRATHLHAMSAAAAFASVLGYDVVAFGSQVLFGWLTDRFTKPVYMVQLGLLLSAVGVALSPFHMLGTVAAAAVGNALFHLGAGAIVLGRGLTRAAPSGLFVAPGALGLGFGLYYGASAQRGPIWPLLCVCLVSFGVVTYRRRALAEGASRSYGPPTTEPVVLPQAKLILLLLLASITIRSLVGLSAARGYARTELLLLGLPFAAFLGKSVGGFLADRFGWIETSVAALLLSLPLISLAPPTLWLLVGLFAFQMTMPVTLTATAQLMPKRLATAFGWTCLALILGALPTMLPFGKPLCGRALLGLWIAMATISLTLGLHLLGVRSWVGRWLVELRRSAADGNSTKRRAVTQPS